MNTADNLTQAATVDALSDRFEAAWKAGERPQIEDFLALAAAEHRGPLLKALLEVEVELLSQLGQQPAAEDYRRRFAQHVETVNAVFATALHARPRNERKHGSARESQATKAGDASPLDIALTVSARSPDTDTSRIGPAPPAPEIPRSKIGRFEIKSVLGQGAFGSVYRARDPQLDRDVAVKVPREEVLATPQDRERFMREARAAATLEHPGVCPVYEVGEEGDQPYIVMALIEGRTLDDLVKSGKAISAKQAANAVRKIALALDEAHGRGIIHRDLKPGNVMINRRGEPVIMDFGLARLGLQVDVQLTRSGVLMGTPAYMSPEQARGHSKDVGPATDVYSLGVILYELVTHRRPFDGSFAEVLGQILHVEPPTPSSLREDIDSRLESIIVTAIAKKPEDRFPSIAAFAAALGEYLREIATQPAAAGEAQQPVQPDAAFVNTLNGSIGSTQVMSEVAHMRTELREHARRQRFPWWLWLVGSGLLGIMVLLSILFFVRSGPATIIIQVPLPPGIDIRDATLAFFLDTKPITPDELEKPIELKPGDHELLIKRGEQLVKRVLFSVDVRDKVANIRIENDETEWPGPLVFDDSLSTPESLARFNYTAGWGGTAVVLPRTGLRLGGGNTTPMVWPRLHLGDRYRIRFEAKFNELGWANWMLNGPGYGACYASGYHCSFNKTDFWLAREGAIVLTVKLSKPIGPDDWATVQVDVDRDTIKLTINGTSLEPFIDASPLTGPLHGWFGLADAGNQGGVVAYRDLRIWSSAADTKREPQFTPPVTERPLANVKLLYELQLTDGQLGPEWWNSHSTQVTVGTGGFVLSGKGTNDTPGMILTRPFQGEIACEIEFDCPTDTAQNNFVMLWYANSAPHSSQDAEGGWIANLDSHSATDVWWHRGAMDSHEAAGFALSSKAPRVANTPHYATVPRRKYVARLETSGDTLRVFLDGGLVLTAKRPDGSPRPASSSVFVGLRQFWSTTQVSRLRVYQLETDDTFVPLFTRNDLAGWQGRLELWSLRDGILTGQPGSGESNTFLFSPRPYANFELRFQTRLGSNDNSGVQIRSEILDRNAWTARGPQADFGHRQGDLWGGIYGEELPGGWLLKPDRTPPITPGDWIDYSVRCVGRHVTIQVNGTTTVDGDVAFMQDTGLLAFQIHRSNQQPVEFRQLRIREITE